jgi:xanthine dehydrogenase YagR molybdenum-binding subunit
MPGVKAVYVISKPGKELYYVGDEILAIAADTEEHARDAVRAVQAEYEVLDFLVQEKDALKEPDKLTVAGRPVKAGERRPGNVNLGGKFARGKVEDALKAPNTTATEGEYGVPTICHQCLESHGLVAKWEGDQLTVWCSTQATFGTAGTLARHFKIPATQVKCITHYMGGGFGSKFGPDVQGIAAAELARKAGAPVKLMLDREEEVISAGNRPSAYGTVRMAADNTGKITAYEVDCYGTPGVGASATVNLGLLPYVYDIDAGVPNVSRTHQVVRLNAGGSRAMRAPGHPQNCVLTDCALDDLAAKLGLDPMQMRLKNVPQNDPKAVQNAPTSFSALRGTIYADEIKKAGELSDWQNKWHPPGKKAVAGPVMHGIGMALHTWGGQGSRPNDMTVTVSRDGSVLIESSTQDLGTGERTVLAVVTAEVFGLNPKDITVRIGESPYGRSGGSGGSTTCPGTAPAILNGATSARDALFDKLASRLEAKKESLVCEDGKIVDKDGGKSWAWKEACAKLGMDTIQARGDWSAGLSNVGVGGVQVAEVLVDTETGQVRCTKVVAVQDCGMVVSKLTCESQVAGGVIMGVNYAMFEERIMDRHTGRQVNPNMEFYKLGGLEDMPQIVVHLHDMPQRGVIGIGEPPTISTCAAIGNAVFNAIGVRVPHAPYTPERVLEALAKKGGKS